MAENDLDDVLSIFDEPKDKEEGQPQEETPAEEPAQAVTPPKPAPGKPGFGKPGLGKPGLGKPGMTGPRPPMGSGKPVAPTPPRSPMGTGKPVAPPAPKAPVQQSAPKPTVASGPTPGSLPAAAPVSGGTSPLLFVLLALNVILLLVCALSFVKVNALNKELTQIKLDTETLKARSKVHAGIAYLGNDKRPQRFIMLLDFDKKPGGVEFGNEKMVPME